MDVDDNSYKNNLFLLRQGEVSQLTSGGEESSFVFEDNEHVLFAAARSKKEKEDKECGLAETSFYRINIYGGEAVPAFSLPLNVNKVEALKEGKYLITATVSQAAPDLYEKSREERLDYAKSKKDKKFFQEAEQIPFWFNGPGYLSSTISAFSSMTLRRWRQARTTAAHRCGLMTSAPITCIHRRKATLFRQFRKSASTNL